jgi:hypothetical protein
MSARDDDRALAKAARAAIARTSLDISELNIQCTGGFIEMNGKLRAPRGAAGTVSVRKEFSILKTQVASVRGVKGVYAERVMVFE